MNKEMDIEKEAAKIFLENVEKIRIQLFTIIVTAYGVLYGIVFSGQIAADILLLIPFIIMTLGMRLKFYDYSVSITGDYIQKYFTEGHTEYLVKQSNPIILFLFDVIPKWLLFIFIPMGIATTYSFMIILKSLGLISSLGFVSFLPVSLHWFFIIIFLSIIVASAYYYLYFKQIKKNGLLKKIFNEKERKELLGW